MEWTDVLKILIGAALAIVSGFVSQVYFARQNELTQRIDELTLLICKYADMGSEYWLSRRSGKKVILDESKIVAIDLYIGTMIANLSHDGARFELHKQIDLLLYELSDTATGGNFQVASRKTSPDRAAQIYANASKLCVALRTERRKLLRMWPFSF